MASVKENALKQVTDIAYFRAVSSTGESCIITKENMVKVLTGLIGNASPTKNGLMSSDRFRRLSRVFGKGYTLLASTNVHYAQYHSLISASSPASTIGGIFQISWRGTTARVKNITTTENSSNIVFLQGVNPSTSRYELWLGIIGSDGFGSETVLGMNDRVTLEYGVKVNVAEQPEYLSRISMT